MMPTRIVMPTNAGDTRPLVSRPAGEWLSIPAPELDYLG